jgi:hypothetical protein
MVAGEFYTAEDQGELLGPGSLVAEPPATKRWALIG